MVAGWGSLLLFEKRAGLDFWRKQQNGDWRGLFVASREKSRIRITKEAAEMPHPGHFCCLWTVLFKI